MVPNELSIQPGTDCIFVGNDSLQIECNPMVIIPSIESKACRHYCCLAELYPFP